MVGRAGTSCFASSCQSRFDDIYNRGEQIDHVLRTNTDESVANKAPLIEIIPGNGSGQKKRVLRFLNRKDIKRLYHRVEN